MPASPFASAPSCPCCFFLTGGGLFLPRKDGVVLNGVGGVRSASSDDQSLSAHVIDPREAWDRISSAPHGEATATRRKIVLVDTHGHPHLERDVQYATDDLTLVDGLVVSLTCAVSPSDWNDALKYASRSPLILPALGIHPWNLADVMMADDYENHDDCEDVNLEKCIDWNWLTDLETHLSRHPRLLVGEIGLCKMARFVREYPKEKGGKAAALQLQRLVFKKQLELAATYSRPVTVHCVNAHGIFMEVMWDFFRKATIYSGAEKGGKRDGMAQRRRSAFPPAIAMHSFTGTAHHVDEILAFERALLRQGEEVDNAGEKKRRSKTNQQQNECPIDHSEPPPGEDDAKAEDILFYFGFSHSVNHLMCTSKKAQRRATEAVRSVPSDRLLVESDVHASMDVTLGTAGAVAYAAHARGEKIEDLAERSVDNGLRFLSSLGSIAST
jgi:Tat protein secretion system quality control protein TatD with DNase activity